MQPPIPISTSNTRSQLPRRDRWRWGVRDPLLGAPPCVKLGNRPSRQHTAAFPQLNHGQSRCRRRGAAVAPARLLSKVMVAAAEQRATCEHPFQLTHAVSRKGEPSRDWLVAPQPSRAASLFIKPGRALRSISSPTIAAASDEKSKSRAMRAAADRSLPAPIVMSGDCSRIMAHIVLASSLLASMLGSASGSDGEVAVSVFLREWGVKRQCFHRFRYVPTNSRD